MKKKLMLMLSCLIMSIGIATAQKAMVSGTVVDETGEPIISASVIVKGTTIGTSTDLDGKFTITLPEDKKNLVFHLIGMKSVEKLAKDGMRVMLEEDHAMLDEIIVVAYGTAKKSTFTGSAGSVDNKVMKDAPIVTFEQALQGASAGMSVTSSTGQPGAMQKIRIRGIGSINASNEPLYVVDGVPMVPDNMSVSGVTNQQGSVGISSFINPSDIENVTILKDAAAAALYGSRGANGVVMITTKSGKSGKTSVSVKASAGFTGWAVRNRPVIGGNELRELWTEQKYNALVDGLPAGHGNAELLQAMKDAQTAVDAVAPYSDNYSDWEGALFRKRGSMQKYDVSVNGGNAKTKFFTSLGYTNEQGMSRVTGLDQFSGRVNITHDEGDFKMGVNMSLSKSNQHWSSEGAAYANPYYMSRVQLAPTTPIYNPDGSYYGGSLLAGNPNSVKDSGLDSNVNRIVNVQASAWAEYKIIDQLKIKQTVNYSNNVNRATVIWPSNSNNGIAQNGIIIKNRPVRSKIYSSSQLSYNKSLGLHNFDAIAVWDVEKETIDELFVAGMGFASENITELAGAANAGGHDSQTDNDRMMSAIGRLNYNYNDRYYGSVSYRADGSSRLGSNKRWGSFWSVSGAWRLSQETFMKEFTFLNDAKIRASYGTNGNLPAGRFESKSTYGLSGGSYNGKPGIYPTRLANPDLSWEINHVLDLGLEAKFFDKLSIELDYYSRTTKDLILDMPVSSTTGFTRLVANIGEMTNKGFELSVGVDLFQERDFSWSTKLNLAHNVNKVQKLVGGNDMTNITPFIRREGEAFYSYHLREYAGIDSDTGQEMWYTNKPQADGTIERSLTFDPNKSDRIVAGKADPDLTGGWQNSFSYKGFDLTALISFQLGGKLYDNGVTATESDGYYGFQRLPSSYQIDRWQKPGDKTRFGRRVDGYKYGNYGSTKFLKSATHARLKNIAVGYSVPSDFARKIGMSRVRLTASATNLLTLKRVRGLDPESGGDNSIVGWSFPPMKNVVFGVELNF